MTRPNAWLATEWLEVDDRRWDVLERPNVLGATYIAIKSEASFTLDAGRTIDLDDAPGELLVQWCCTKNTFPFAGRECDNTGFPGGGYCSAFSPNESRTFNSPSRPFQQGDYEFTVNVKKGERSAASTLSVVLAETGWSEEDMGIAATAVPWLGEGEDPAQTGWRASFAGGHSTVQELMDDEQFCELRDALEWMLDVSVDPMLDTDRTLPEVSDGLL